MLDLVLFRGVTGDWAQEETQERKTRPCFSVSVTLGDFFPYLSYFLLTAVLQILWGSEGKLSQWD